MPRRKDIYMIIGIMGAMPDEVDQLCAKLENVTVEPYGGVEYHRGTLAGKQVVVCCAGMGKANAPPPLRCSSPDTVPRRSSSPALQAI